MQTAKSDLGAKVKFAAKQAGLTLAELGIAIEVSRPTIYAYASGALPVPDKRLEAIAETTGQPVSFFRPTSPEQLHAKSDTAQSLKLIDALLSPANPKSATKAAEDALEELPSGTSPAIRAELLRRSGNALAAAGDFVESIRKLEEARPLFEAAGDVPKVGSCYQTLGYCYVSLGNLDQAEQCFSRALESLSADQKWKAEIATAALLERTGKFAMAEAQLGKLLDSPTLGGPPLAYVRANYASIVCSQGAWRSGLAQTETALEDAYANLLSDQISEMLIQAATALTHLGRLEEATLMAMRARDVAAVMHDESRGVLADVTMGRILQTLGRGQEARTAASEALARATQGQFRRSESAALLLLAELALDRGDHQSALEIATQAIAHAKAHIFLVSEAQGHWLAARAETSMGIDPAPARLERLKACAAECGEGQLAAWAHEVAGRCGEALKLSQHLGHVRDVWRLTGVKDGQEPSPVTKILIGQLANYSTKRGSAI